MRWRLPLNPPSEQTYRTQLFLSCFSLSSYSKGRPTRAEKKTRNHFSFYEKNLIFSTEGKADLHLNFQNLHSRARNIFSHKLKACFKLSFLKSQGFTALHAPEVGPCLSARLVRKQTTQAICNDRQILMNFGACLVLAFMDHKIIWLFSPPC